MVARTVFNTQCAVYRKAVAIAKSHKRLMRILKPFCFILVLLNTEHWILNTAQAKSLGVHGIIYPIEEQDPIVMIQQGLKMMEKTGELERHNLELQKKARASVERPNPVEGITRAIKGRVFYYDPTYEVKEDLYDHLAQRFAKKGTRINPLKTVNLSADLIFFDGDDKKQLEWVKGQLSKSKETKAPRLILVKGPPLKLSEEFGISIYFDQNAVLTHKLGIKHVPASVTQEELLLRIEEIDLREERSFLTTVNKDL